MSFTKLEKTFFFAIATIFVSSFLILYLNYQVNKKSFDPIHPVFSEKTLNADKLNSLSSQSASIENPINIEQTVLTTQSLNINTLKEIDLSNLPSNLPTFINVEKDKIKINPSKNNVGIYKFILNSIDQSIFNYTITIKIQDADFDKLTEELKKYISDDPTNYGIYVHDLLRDKTISINGGTIFEPASIAKMPVAVLVMRDIDQGKYTLDTTYPLKDSEKFSFIGSLGSLPDESLVSIEEYLNKMLIDSDNNAWYALVNFLGKSYQVVNPRIINELGVNPLFLDPAKGTAENIGKVFSDIYFSKTLSKKSSDYIFNLLENALTSNREGIGLGLPPGIRFANKIGTLSVDEKTSYQDGAVVWGSLTDYVIVVMDKNLSWDLGKVKLKGISSIVYNGIN